MLDMEKLKKTILSEKPAAEIVKVAGLRGLTRKYSCSNADLRNIAEILRAYFWDATPLSKRLSAQLGIRGERLRWLYSIFRDKDLHQLQDFLSQYSMERRQISFMRELLAPEKIGYLEKILHAGNVMPFAVEFHTSDSCNLRCKGCPNIAVDRSTNKGRFLQYRERGERLDAKKLQMIVDMFLAIGIRRFIFGGGGEPCMKPLLQDQVGLTRAGMDRLAKHGKKLGAQAALYTNGVFDPGPKEEQLEFLVTHVHKIRFSIDATNRRNWCKYKSGSALQYDLMRSNLRNLVHHRDMTSSNAKIGASCLVSKYTCAELPRLLQELQNDGVDFCDIKELAVSSEEKERYKPDGNEVAENVGTILDKVRNGSFGDLNVVFDDSFIWQTIPEEQRAKWQRKRLQDRCWSAINGQLLTIGPYGDLQPCSNAENPGFREELRRRGSAPLRLGILTDFESPHMLQAQFQSLWDISLKRRMLISRGNCTYCVPANFNYNFVIEKLYQDWAWGINLTHQPIVPEVDPYLTQRWGQDDRPR